MRWLVDRDGSRWNVVLGRESWGGLVVLFVPDAAGPVRQANFAAASYDIAVVEFDELDAAQLQLLLDESQPKPD